MVKLQTIALKTKWIVNFKNKEINGIKSTSSHHFTFTTTNRLYVRVVFQMLSKTLFVFFFLYKSQCRNFQHLHTASTEILMFIPCWHATEVDKTRHNWTHAVAIQNIAIVHTALKRHANFLSDAPKQADRMTVSQSLCLSVYRMDGWINTFKYRQIQLL